MGEVGEQCFAPPLLVDGLAHVTVEIAIGAFGEAEGPVDVECYTPFPFRGGVGGGGIGRGWHCPTPTPPLKGKGYAHNSAVTSLRKASARWLIACFCAGSLSPTVMSWPIGWNIG